MGISFSALELPIRAPGGDAAIKTLADIDRKAQQMSKEITASLGAFDRLGKQLDVTDRAAVKAFRASAAAEREWLNISRANTEQHAKLTQTIQAVDQRMQRAGPNFQRSAQASVIMAGGIESIARTGNVASEGLKQIVVQGSNIAFMFGTAGPIIGAVGVLGVAMFNFWDRTRREIEETRIKGIQELETLARGADLVGASMRQQYAYTGDPYAIRRPDESDAAFLARSQGLAGVQPRLAAVRSQLQQQAPGRLAQLDQGMDPVNTALLRRMMPVVGEYLDLKQAEEELRSTYEQTTGVVNRLTEVESRRAQNGQRIAADERAKAEALKTANAERERALQLAQEGLRLEKGGSSGLGLSLTTSGVDVASRRRLEDAFGMPEGNNKFANIKLPKPTEAIDLIRNSDYGRLVVQFEEQLLKPMAATLQSGIAMTIGSAVSAGFAAGFSGDGLDGIFASFGTAVLQGIGGIFMQLGAVWIEYGLMMTQLTAGLFNPVTSGPTALAIGALLIGLGAALGAIGGGRGAGGGGYRSGAGAGGVTQIIDRGIINPVAAPRGSNAPITPREAVTQNFWVIGENDPRAQSALRRMVQAPRGNL